MLAMETMRYVIMANGRGTRWGNYLGKSKHLIEIDGETLLQRTTRLIREIDSDAEIYISSSNPDNVAVGAVRHAPLRAGRELDRFCYELISPCTCFLYGDTYYTDEALRTIAITPARPLVFFGNDKSIVGVKSADEATLKMLIDILFERIDLGVLADAKGWDLYRLACAKIPNASSDTLFVRMDDMTQDFNSPDDYRNFMNGNGTAQENA